GVTGIAHTGVNGENELFSLGYTLNFLPNSYEYVFSANRYDGQTWTSTELLRAPPFGARLASIYAIKSGEAMVVGDAGRAFWYHGGVWTQITTNVTTDLLSAWGPDPDHLYITGTHGTVLMWERSNPTVMMPDTTFPATTSDLGTVSGADGEVWIAIP